MNVYMIGQYWIAAKTVDEALGVYVEETNELEDLVVDEPADGEVEEVTISIHKLTKQQIEAPDMYCCDNGPCEFCKDSDDAVLVPLQTFINRRDEHEFPCVIAREE